MKKMKQTVSFIFGLLLIPLMAAQGVAIYEETFDNPLTDSPLTNINWNAAITTNGTVYTGSNGAGGPILSVSDFLYTTGSGSGLIGGPWLVWTEEAAVGVIGLISNVTRVSMNLSNAAQDEDIKVAVKVDGAWYVSQAVLNNAEPNVYSNVVFDVQSAAWNTLTFVPGSTLVEGGAAGVLSGTVQAVGLFDASAGDGGKVRVDDFEVSIEMDESTLVFEETFSNAGTDAPLTNISWNANIGTNGTSYTGSSGSYGPILSSQDYLFTRPVSTSGLGGAPMLAWTEKEAVGSIGDIASDMIITAELRNENTAEDLKFVIRVGTSWFVSRRVFNVSDISTTTSIGVAVQYSDWNSLDFVAESTLAEGEAADLPSSGTITAVGVFDAGLTIGKAIRVPIMKVYVPSSSDPWHAAWNAEYNLSGADAELTADPDADGMNNLVEYALGGNPTNTDASSILPGSVLVDAGGTNWLEHTYFRRLDAGLRGLSYEILRTDDLVDGVWTDSGVFEIGSGPVDADFEAVTNRISTAGYNNQFLRLNVGME
jgi:hypothetical protein